MIIKRSGGGELRVRHSRYRFACCSSNSGGSGSVDRGTAWRAFAEENGLPATRLPEASVPNHLSLPFQLWVVGRYGGGGRLFKGERGFRR
ncbi:hypothetical protein GCM10009745_70730 [Kribbella yunnanensis]|uniref:Uncharacterized protein n=1 Tax=Kribbella yunnanensis TaxID=190194 RepID=A0ABN2IV74_9ACTN